MHTASSLNPGREQRVKKKMFCSPEQESSARSHRCFHLGLALTMEARFSKEVLFVIFCAQLSRIGSARSEVNVLYRLVSGANVSFLLVVVRPSEV
jgi:hypothetical protein